MLGSKVIEALDGVRPPDATWASEAALVGAIETELRRHGVKFLRRPLRRTRQPVLIVDSLPNLLVLVSVSGDTQMVTKAAAQLQIDQKGLPLTRPVMVLGSPPEHASLRRALSQLGIILVECG